MTLLLALLKAEEEMCRASRSLAENQAPTATGLLNVYAIQGLSINVYMPVFIERTICGLELKKVF